MFLAERDNVVEALTPAAPAAQRSATPFCHGCDRRSSFEMRGLGVVRFSTASCCRRARFSTTRLARLRNDAWRNDTRMRMRNNMARDHGTAWRIASNWVADAVFGVRQLALAVMCGPLLRFLLRQRLLSRSVHSTNINPGECAEFEFRLGSLGCPPSRSACLQPAGMHTLRFFWKPLSHRGFRRGESDKRAARESATTGPTVAHSFRWRSWFAVPACARFGTVDSGRQVAFSRRTGQRPVASGIRRRTLRGEQPDIGPAFTKTRPASVEGWRRERARCTRESKYTCPRNCLSAA